MIYVKLVLMAGFWGGTFIAGRLISAHLGPFTAAFIRFILAALILNLIALHQNGWKTWFPDKSKWMPLILLGITGIAFYNALFFKGLQTVEAGRAAAIVAMNPIFIALFSALLLKERIKGLQTIGFMLSVAGALVVVSRGNMAQLFRGGLETGDLYIFGCVFTWAAYSLIGKFILHDMSPLRVTASASLVGAILLFVPAMAEGMIDSALLLHAPEWTALFYLAVFGTVIGFVWYYQGVRSIGAARASQFINLVPVFAILFAMFLLDEPLSKSLIIGASLVVAGVYLGQSTKM